MVDEKYGSKLKALAANILQSREDGLECVNDTYMKAWNSIPPARPEHLFAFLETVDKNKRIIFLRRYWYSDSIKDISERMQMSESAVKVTLHRMRKELRKYLESEGLYL